jgi:large subunit ribosomal protein L29
MAKSRKKAEDLRRMSDDDLAKALEEAYRQLFTLRLQLSTRQLSNVMEVRRVRRQIARMKTIQQERLLAAVLAGQGGA